MTVKRIWRWGISAVVVAMFVGGTLKGEGWSDHLKTLEQVGPKGQGNREAIEAWKNLAEDQQVPLVELLRAISEDKPIASNWIRSLVEVKVAGMTRRGEAFPLGDLGELLMDRRMDGRARRMAFELIAKADPEVAERLVPGFLGDPAVELRRDAVERLLVQGTEWKGEGRDQGAILLFRQALDAGREVDQIQRAADGLKDLGIQVWLPDQFGFLMDWKLIGPFDNSSRAGFEAVFSPEKALGLNQVHTGKEGKQVRWADFRSHDEYGQVDLNRMFGDLKSVTGYAYAEFLAEQDRTAEIRLGCKNAWKIWVNGDFVFGRDEYHRGARIDQYRLPIALKEGRNGILVKICQNEQMEEWTKEWEFQLRICDSAGTAILSLDRPSRESKN